MALASGHMPDCQVLRTPWRRLDSSPCLPISAGAQPTVAMQAARALCRTKSKPRACTLLCRVDTDQLLFHGSQTAWQHGSCAAVAGTATLMEAPGTSVTLQPTPTKTSTPVPQVRRDCLRGSSSWNVEAVQRSHSSRRELGTGRDMDMAQVCEVGEVRVTRKSLSREQEKRRRRRRR